MLPILFLFPGPHYLPIMLRMESSFSHIQDKCFKRGHSRGFIPTPAHPKLTILLFEALQEAILCVHIFSRSLSIAAVFKGERERDEMKPLRPWLWISTLFPWSRRVCGLGPISELGAIEEVGQLSSTEQTFLYPSLASVCSPHACSQAELVMRTYYFCSRRPERGRRQMDEVPCLFRCLPLWLFLLPVHGRCILCPVSL